MSFCLRDERRQEPLVPHPRRQGFLLAGDEAAFIA